MKLLALFIKNVSENPTDEKYRSINTQSNAFKTKLQPFVGPMNILRSLGFEKDEEGKMRLSADPDVALFASTLTKLQTAMETFAKMNNSF